MRALLASDGQCHAQWMGAVVCPGGMTVAEQAQEVGHEARPQLGNAAVHAVRGMAVTAPGADGGKRVLTAKTWNPERRAGMRSRMEGQLVQQSAAAMVNRSDAAMRLMEKCAGSAVQGSVQ